MYGSERFVLAALAGGLGPNGGYHEREKKVAGVVRDASLDGHVPERQKEVDAGILRELDEHHRRRTRTGRQGRRHQFRQDDIELREAAGRQLVRACELQEMLQVHILFCALL